MAPGLQVKSCSVEGCPVVDCSMQKLGSIAHWRLQLINSWSCLKTIRILQIQSSWHRSKTLFSIVNWRELDSRTLFLEKSIPLPHFSSLFSFEDKCRLGRSWRIWLAAFLWDIHCHFSRLFGKSRPTLFYIIPVSKSWEKWERRNCGSHLFGKQHTVKA